MKKRNKSFVVVLVVFLYLLIGIVKDNNAVLANQLDGYYFEGYWYNGGSTYNIPMMILKEYENGVEIIHDNGPGVPQGILVYCLDIDLDYPFYNDPVKHFEQTSFNSSEYDLDKIKGILAEGYPQKSLKYLQDTLNIPSLTPIEAIAATQYAIWSISDSINLDYWKIQSLPPTIEEEILFNHLKDKVYVKPQELVFSFSDVKTQRLTENSKDLIEIIGKINFSHTEQSLTLKISDYFKSSYPQAKVELIKSDNHFDFKVILDEIDARSFIKTGTLSFDYSYNNDIQEFHFVAPGPQNSKTIQSLGGVTIKEKLKSGSINIDVKEKSSLLMDLTDYTVKKVWNGGPAVKPDITIQLYQNDVEYGEPIILKDGTLNYTWKDLDKTDPYGNLYSYRVDEINVPISYSKTIRENTIINTYEAEKTDYTVKKVWNGGPAVKPDITIQLYQNDVEYGEPIILKDGTLNYTWKDLDKTDPNGNLYSYRVDEINVPISYSKTIRENTIINTYEAEKTDYTVKKVWNGGPAVKPDITIQLYQNDVEYGEPIILKDGTLNYTWKDLDKTDPNGNLYSYRVDEINVPISYSKTVSGNTIVNTFTDMPNLPNTGQHSATMINGISIIGFGVTLLYTNRLLKTKKD